MASLELTDKDKVKEYLGIPASDTSKDDMIDDIISAVCAEMELYCEREFALDTYTEQINGNGEDRVRLRNTPIEGILYSAKGRTSLIEITYNGVKTGFIDVQEKEIRLTDGLSQTDIAIGDDDTIADVVASIDADGSCSATVQDSELGNYPGRILTQRTYSILESGDCADLVGPTSCIYLREENDGLYLSSSTIENLCIVLYNGGYAPDAVPAGLEQLATQISADTYKSLGQQANLKSEKIGDYSYQMNNNISTVMEAYSTRLDFYRSFSI